MRETLSIDAPADIGTRLRDAIGTLDDAFSAFDRGGSLEPIAVAFRNDGFTATAALLASLACGRRARVRRLLRTPAPGWADAAPAGTLPLLLARYHAWTGDLTTASALWPAVLQATETLAATAAPPRTSARVLRAGALAGIQRAATDLGDPQAAARLHRAARDAVADSGLVATPEARLLRALDIGAAGDADADPGAFAVPRATRDPGVTGAAAFSVLRIAHDVLGVAPDAPRHRVWLRPRLPAGTLALSARGIATGEDSLSLDVEAAGSGKLTVRVRQDVGPIPATALLELRLPGPLRSALVDGAKADLTARPVARADAAAAGGGRGAGGMDDAAGAAGGWLVAVQLVLDHERRVELCCQT